MPRYFFDFNKVARDRLLAADAEQRAKAAAEEARKAGLILRKSAAPQRKRVKD